MTESTTEITVIESTVQEDVVEAVVSVSQVSGSVSESVVEAEISADIVNAVTEESVVYGTIVGQQGPPGVSSEGSGASFQTTNKEGSTVRKGQPAAMHSTGVGIVLADASTSALPAVGLMRADASDLAACTVQTAGPFTLDDWTNVIGSESLAAKGIYYLDTSSGMLTTTSPSQSPAISQRIGKALSPTILDIDIWQFVQL